MLPHVWDSIIQHAPDVKTLLTIRAVSRDLGKAVDRALLTHLAITGCPRTFTAPSVSCYYPAVARSISRGYILAPWRNSFVRIRLPFPNTRRAKEIRDRCSCLDIRGRIPPYELDDLAYLMQPKTLRLLILTTTGPPSCPFVYPDLSPLGIIHPHTAIISRLTVIPSLSSSRHLRRTTTLPDCTRRLVLHQGPWHFQQLLPHGTSLRELVLVFIVTPSPTTMVEYLSELAPELYNVTITVVGFEDSPTVGTIKLAADLDHQYLVFRTRAEHRSALGKAQWETEMEL
jgi:hypothetical protein